MPRIIGLSGKHEDWFDGERAQVVPYHRMYGKQYCLPAFVCYEQAIVNELREAAEALDRIFWKTMRFVQRYLDDSVFLRQLGLSPALLAVARMEVPHHAIARQDWIVHGNTLKLIEYNTDTPTGVPETAWLAGDLMGAYNRQFDFTSVVGGVGQVPFANPARDMERLLAEAFTKLVELYREAGYAGKLFFSCHEQHVEDRHNTLYLQRVAEAAGIEVAFVPLSELRIVPGDGLYAGDERIEMLYRLYPLEYLPSERDADGYPIGEALLELVAAGRLMLINPPQSVLTQSKGMLALIWALYRRNELMVSLSGLSQPLFNEEECAAIARWMLPADWSAEAFRTSDVDYVSKGFYGREGKGTDLILAVASGQLQVQRDVRESERQVADEVTRYYDEQPKVYQQYEPMLSLQVPTEEGMYEGYLLTGVFVVGRQFAGILPRIGDRITGDMAYFCAAVTEESF